jgi:hypothetical protein
MKRINRDYNQTGPIVSLYRDDIDRIIDLVNEYCGNASISDGEYDYESLDKLAKNRGPRPRRLIVTRRSRTESYGYCNLELSNGFCIVGVGIHGSGNQRAVDCCLAIRRLLEARRRWLAYLPSSLVFVIASIALLLVRTLVSSNASAYLLLEISWISSCVLAVATAITSHGSLSSVNLSLKHETSTFWSRNSEKWIGGVIGSILTAAALAAAAAIWKWLSK